MPNEFKVKNGLLVSGSANINSSGSAVFTIDGTVGRLFQVDDSLSGSLFSVNTSAGLPVIEVFSDNTVRIGQFGQRALFVSQSRIGINKESALNGVLDVSGSLTVTGSVTATNFTGSLLGTSSFAISASWAPGGSGGGTPGGANTNIQFNEAGTFSGSGNFTFTKATNTVQIQGSGSVLLRITGSSGELLRVVDSGSNSPILATMSSGSVNIYTFTTSSLIITGSVQAGVKTQDLHYGYLTAPATASTINDYNPTGWSSASPNRSVVLNISASTSTVITGLAGGSDGRLVVLKNGSADRLIILADSSSLSAVGNRFDLRNTSFLVPNGTITFVYDAAAQQWEPMGSSGGSGYGAYFNEYEDFLGAANGVVAGTATEVGRFAVIANGTGASGQIAATPYLVNTTEKPLGVYQIDTGTTTTGRAHLGSTVIDSIIPANGNAICLSRLAVEALSTSTEGYQVYFGWQDGATVGGLNAVTDGVYWQYNTASSTAWQGATANNGTRTTTGAAGPTVDTNYIWLGIFVNPTWTRATYFYSTDSRTWTIAGEITTNLPTAVRSTGFGALINKTVGTTAANLSIDLMAHRYDILRG